MRRCLWPLAIVAWIAGVGCQDPPALTGPTGPSGPSTPVSVTMTGTIEGTVRVVGEGPRAGVPVVVSGVDPSGPFRAVSDQNGHYSLPSMRVQSPYVYLSAQAGQEYTSSVRYLQVSAASTSWHIDLPIQPSISVVDAVDFQLTNDDIELGADIDATSGLPPHRWPVKVVQFRPPPSGGLRIQADWSGSTPVRIWLETRYSDESLESEAAPGQSSAVLSVRAAWLQDPRSGGFVLSVGVPYSAAGVSAPIDVHLTVAPDGPP